MFCRSCWANLPDGTERCPKCQRDPRVAAAPPPETPPPRAVVTGVPAARAARLVRLNVLLSALLVALVGGPPVARWWQARGRPPSTSSSTLQAAPPAPATARGDLDASLPAVPASVAAPREDDPDGRAAREAYALYQEGRVAEACGRYEEIVRRAGPGIASRSLAGCYARLGRDLYHAGRPAEAARQYRLAVETHAERAYWMGLAVAHARAGDLAQAQAVVEQALRDFPDDPDLLYVLADVQERQGRTRDALDTLHRLIARDAGHARGRTLLARLEREQKYEAGYWSQESPHFLVRYEGGSGIEVGRSVVDMLEQAYESLGRDLGVYPRQRVQVGIYVTRTFAEIGGIPPEFAEHVLGFYDSQKLRLRLSASQAGSLGLERLVRHEYAHLLIQEATKGRAPRWLHEGLAQVLEPRPAPRLIETDVALDRRDFTLAGLERMFRSNAIGAAYQLSHILCAELVDRGGMSGVRAFLGRLGQGEPLPQALKEGAGVSVADLEGRLLAAGGRS